MCGQEPRSLCPVAMTTRQVPNPSSSALKPIVRVLFFTLVSMMGTEYLAVGLPGHTVKRVMWFRVSSEGRREFAHHTDPNQISLSYRGRTR